MMTRRKLALAVVVLATAAFASTPILGAVFTQPTLEALEDAAVVGTTTPLLVEVDPALVGGSGFLYAKHADGETFRLGLFALQNTSFVIKAPVPSTASAGEALTYYYYCRGTGTKLALSSNGASVFLKSASEGDEPPIWD